VHGLARNSYRAYRELIAGRFLKTMKDEEGPEVQFVSTTIGTGSGPPPGISSSSFAVVEVTRRSEMAAGPGGGMDPANSLEFLARYGLVILPALVVAEAVRDPSLATHP